MKLFPHSHKNTKVGKKLPFEGYNMATKTTILENILRKQPSTRKSYRVALIVPDNGIPYIEYQQLTSLIPRVKPKKIIDFTDILFTDKNHEKADKFAFSVYTTDKTIVFLAPDEHTMMEWLSQIRDQHFGLFPDFKQYTSIFEARILERGLGKSMEIQGQYRLALCKDSLDLIPILATTTIQPAIDCSLITKEIQSEQKKSSKTSGDTKSNGKTTGDVITTTTNSSGGVPDVDKSSKTTSTKTNTIPMTTNDTNTSVNNINTKSSTGTDDSVKVTDVSDHLDSAETHPIHPRPRRNQQRFHKLHPLLSSKTIELILRSIRRCGHTDNQFYIEPGRHSQTGQGDIWLLMNKKSTVRIFHELLLNAMKASANIDDNFPQSHKSSRSRSGSSNENGLKLQQAGSTSQICLSTNINSDTQAQTVVGSPRSLINQFLTNCNITNSDSNGNLVTTTPTPASVTPGTSLTMNNSIISSTPTSTTLSTTEENDGYIQMA